jgi:hypothetical protein
LGMDALDASKTRPATVALDLCTAGGMLPNLN